MNEKINPIPVSLARLLQEYDFESVDIEQYANLLIERTLEMGNWDELRWLFHTYSITNKVFIFFAKEF